MEVVEKVPKFELLGILGVGNIITNSIVSIKNENIFLIFF